MPIPPDRPYVQHLANYIWRNDDLRRLINGYGESHDVQVDGQPTRLRCDETSLKGQLTMFRPEVYLVFNRRQSGEIELRVELKVESDKIVPEVEEHILRVFEANRVHGFINKNRPDVNYAIVQKSWGKELTGPQLLSSDEWIPWFHEELTSVVRGGKAFCRPRPDLSK